MSASLAKPIQLIIDQVVSSVDQYNRGLAHCEPSPNDIYVRIFVFLFIVGFLVLATGGKLREYWLSYAAISIVFALIVVLLFHCDYRGADTPSRIYRDPHGSARYGCLYHSKPISLGPLFNDKKVIAHIGERVKHDWQDEIIKNTIALLRSFSIENYYVNNCTCVC